MKMKNKIRIIISTLMSIILTFTVIAVNVKAADLSVLKGTGKSKIGSVFTLTYNNLQGNKGLYCIQKNKPFKGQMKYSVKNYVEINGKEATVYSSSTDSNPRVVSNNYNAEMAYILGQNQGYSSTGENYTDAQYAVWSLTNNWTSELFGDAYKWYHNSEVGENSINARAHEYANTVGDNKAPTGASNSDSTKLSVADKTNKDSLKVSSSNGYYRVGPFRWEFDGYLQSVKVTGDNGDISSANVKLIKYNGTSATEVSASSILTGEAFYIDINQNSEVSSIKGLTLNTTSTPTGETTTVYTAKIWFLQSSSYQNVIYVDASGTQAEPNKGTGNGDYDIPLTMNINIIKVDDRDENKTLSGVKFKFRTQFNVKNGSGNWEYTDFYLTKDGNWRRNDGDEFATDSNGSLVINNVKRAPSEETNGSKGSIDIIETYNPYYGYDLSKINPTSFKIPNGADITIKLKNHQSKVKLSGYVWLDVQSGKTTVRNDVYDSDFEQGFDGIKVYLKDTNGNTIKTTTTSELGLYSEITGGEYEFVDVNLDELQKGSYYIEFEYCGITYQSVAANLGIDRGSKAIDTATRNILDNKFSSVDGNGTQNLNVNGVSVNYNNTDHYASTINSHSGCEVYARTNEAGFNIYNQFTPTAGEIRNVNLGIYEKAQTDYALAQDLYNVRVSVNGYSHIYRYGSVRYNQDGNINEESSWNVGVKFQNSAGTYTRAIYESDVVYSAPNHTDNELKVYVTYKIALKNESSYLGRINSIVNYSDSRYELISAGTTIDDNDNITGNVNYSEKQVYNNEYSKYIVNVNSTIESGKAQFVYLQFRLDKAAVIAIMNQKETLNNVAEINSYTTLKDNKTIAVLDRDSVPGNAVPGNFNTYEDDTDAARSLQLELKNTRALEGTVFVDSTGKDSNTVYTNQERLGNGIFDNGETTLSGIKVKLHETGKDDNSYDGERVEMETTTDDNGNFTFTGYVPGNYLVTYTWGDKTYKVQYYKGTIYDEIRDQNNKYWYKDNVDTRKTDALDNSSIRTAIDDEMEKVKINTLESEVNAAYEGKANTIKITTMESNTPTMTFGVEYETTITDGNADQVKFTIKNIDFGIVERPKQQLEISKRVSGFKVTLANGQILIDATVTEDGKLQGSHDYTTYVAPTSSNGIDSNGMIRTEMDNELIEGSTVEITYTMKVTNIGEQDYSSDKYYYYGNKNSSETVKISATGLLDYVDKNINVLDDKWEEKDISILKDVNANQKNDTEYINTIRTYLTSKLSKSLAPGESNTVDLKTSKLLTSTANTTFDNKAEVVEVTKDEGFSTGTPVKVKWNEDQSYFDSDNSEKVVIVPSTGENKNTTLPIIIGLIAITIIGAGTFVIKKFIIK